MYTVANAGPNESARRWLAWLLAQGKVEGHKTARALGLTQAAVARRLKISDRAIRHYLAPASSDDHRDIPDHVLGRLDDIIDEAVAALRTRRTMRDEEDDLDQYRPRDLPLPLRQERYKRPRKLGPIVTESEIFHVDVFGLNHAEIASVLYSYWRVLIKTRRRWDVRFLVRIMVADYFAGGIEDREIARSIHNRSEISIWIPRTRQQRAFVNPNYTSIGPDIPVDNIMSVLDSDEYRDRILEVEKIAFIPFNDPRNDKPGRGKRETSKSSSNRRAPPRKAKRKRKSK